MTIFGYKWEEIKQAQQGGSLARRLPPGLHKPLATPGDWELLSRYGEDELRNRAYYGVLDRLENTRLAVGMPDCDRDTRRDNPTSGNAKMNKFEFIRANGKRIKANRFMEGPTLRPGMAWRDESPLGSDDHSWREVPSPHSPESDPNHPSYNNKIFGYDEKEFMARQYKTSRQKNPAYLVDVGTRGDLVPRINKLEFQAKRWFQKTYGNTYFAVKVYVNDALVYTSPVEYGYERQYETDAANALAEMGFDVPKGHMMGYWARENGIEFISNAVDVKTERELKAFAAPKKRGKNPTTVSLTPAKATRYLIVLTKVGKVAGYWTGTTWDDERRMGKRYVSEANVKKAAAKIAYITRYVNYKIGVLTVKESVPKK